MIIENNGNHKLLHIGETTSLGLELVSSNSREAVFKDTEGNLIRIGISNEISNRLNDYDNTKTESILLDKTNQYLTNIIINDNPNQVNAIVDTGATLVSINSNMADSLGIEYKKTGLEHSVETASQLTKGYQVVLKSIQLGSIKLFEIPAIIIEGSFPSTVLIGMSFLKNLELKYSDNKLDLSLN